MPRIFAIFAFCICIFVTACSSQQTTPTGPAYSEPSNVQAAPSARTKDAVRIIASAKSINWKPSTVVLSPQKKIADSTATATGRLDQMNFHFPGNCIDIGFSEVKVTSGHGLTHVKIQLFEGHHYSQTCTVPAFLQVGQNQLSANLLVVEH